MNTNYADLLKENMIFQGSDNRKIIYLHHEPEYVALEEKYHISEVAGKSDLEKVFNLLAWVNGHIHHTGNYDNSDEQDALTLLTLAFNTNFGINCLAMSIVLCECLLAVNVKARVMYMMPFGVEDGDNHVVVEAYISEQNKWIMVDPTYGSYCIGTDGEIDKKFAVSY